MAVRAVVPMGRTLQRGSFTITYPPQAIDLTSCSVTAANVTGTCTGSAGSWAVSINKVQGVILTGSVSLISIDIAVKAPGSYSITFASPSFLDEAGIAVSIGLEPIVIVAGGTPTATRTATRVPATSTSTATQTVTATAVTPAGMNVTNLGAGSDHTCGVERVTGNAWCWGVNSSGQLGDGTSGYGGFGANRTAPVPVAGGRVFASLAVGAYHTCGLVAGTGRAWCWGYNASGQVGDGTSGDGYSGAERIVPVPVAGATAFASLVAGYGHTCGVEAGSGKAWCWGFNGYGQLGDGTSGNGGSSANRTAPVEVAGGRLFSSLAAGGQFTCGVEQATGKAWCWGWNDIGQMGDGTSINRTAPEAVAGERVFGSLVAGYMHTCGIETGTARAWCWGGNPFGGLGVGTSGNGSSTANQVEPVAVTGGKTFASLSAGHFHTCGVEQGTSKAWCWGYNSAGQVGDGASATSAYDFTANRTSPIAVTGQRMFASLVAGANHSCGVEQGTGKAWCWGYNGTGQLGDGTSGSPGDWTSANRTIPVAVIRRA